MVKTKRNLLIGFSTSLILLTASSISSYISISNLIVNNEWVAHTKAVTINLERIISSLKDAETGQRGYLLTREKEFLEPYYPAKEHTLAALDSVADLTIDNEEQQSELPELKKQIGLRYSYLQQLIELRQTGVVITSQMMLIGKYSMDKVRATVARMKERENKLLQERTTALRKSVRITSVFLVIAALLSIVITIVYYWRIRKDYRRQVLLEEALQHKEREVARKIEIVEKVAGKISQGDYSVRITEEDLQ